MQEDLGDKLWLNQQELSYDYYNSGHRNKIDIEDVDEFS